MGKPSTESTLSASQAPDVSAVSKVIVVMIRVFNLIFQVKVQCRFNYNTTMCLLLLTAVPKKYH